MTAMSVGLLAFYRRSLGPVEPSERAEIERSGEAAAAEAVITHPAEPDGVGGDEIAMRPPVLR